MTTLPERVLDIILTQYANNAIVLHGDPQYGGKLKCFGIVRSPVSHSPA